MAQAKDTQAVWLRCAGASCRTELRLTVHKVDRYGRVSPDVHCTKCHHAAEYELHGWPGGVYDPPKA